LFILYRNNFNLDLSLVYYLSIDNRVLVYCLSIDYSYSDFVSGPLLRLFNS